MLKLVKLSKCSTSTIILSQILPRNIRFHGSTGIIFEEFKKEYQQQQWQNKKINKEFRNKYTKTISQENIDAVKFILQKYNIDTTNIKNKSIFYQSPWKVEQIIMLLQEMGVPVINTKFINRFQMEMRLPVSSFKNIHSIDSNVNIAKNLFSCIGNANINLKDIEKLSEDMPMKVYLSQCFIYYLKAELGLDNNQIKYIFYRKRIYPIYNSLRLTERFLKLLKNNLNFTTSRVCNDTLSYNFKLLKQYRVFAYHPKQAEEVVKILTTELRGINLSFLEKYLKILRYNLTDLKILMLLFKKYDITPNMIEVCYNIFKLDPIEFERRIKKILNDPLTLVFYKNPKFLKLVSDYPRTIPRILYLKQKNHKYATISSLTSFHNYKERLDSARKTSIIDLKSLFDRQFHEDAPILLENIKKHTYFLFVPLVQIYDTHCYLQKHFSKEVIYEHIYAILYNKDDIEIARQALLNNPDFNQLTPSQLLALCIYRIEEKYHFTGEGVLTTTENINNVQENEENDSIFKYNKENVNNINDNEEKKEEDSKK